jgi:hypothetical protein
LILSDKFWNYFVYCFRFHWPHTLSEAYEIDRSSGLFRFSGVYENYIREINMWAMDLKFFSAFPETYEDMTPSISVPEIINLGARHAPRSLPLPEFDNDEEWRSTDAKSMSLGQAISSCDTPSEFLTTVPNSQDLVPMWTPPCRSLAWHQEVSLLYTSTDQGEQTASILLPGEQTASILLPGEHWPPGMGNGTYNHCSDRISSQ